MKNKAVWISILVAAILLVCGVAWGEANNGTGWDMLYKYEHMARKKLPPGQIPFPNLPPESTRNKLGPPSIVWAPGPSAPAAAKGGMSPFEGHRDKESVYKITNYLIYPGGKIYMILAGSLVSDPSQGIIVFVQSGNWQEYRLPTNSGPATFTGVKDGILSFTTTGQLTGTVSITTGKVTISPQN